MGFEKGKDKTGGRQKGGKNKKTTQWEEFAKFCMEGGLDRYKEELLKLEGKDFVNAFQNQMEYFKPKLSRREITGEDGKPIAIQYYELPDGTKLIFD